MASVKACAPYFYMIVSQFAYAGSSILGKLALGQGLSALAFIVYRHLIAMLILAPLAYVLERNRRPSFSFGVMLKIFILAMLGITIQQNVYYVGLHLISPTVASALGNVIPAFTFLLAIVLRMEKLNLKTVRGRARLAGIIFCITGALIFTFWKGHLLGAFVTSPMIQLHFESPEKGDAWLKGFALMLFGYFVCSVSLVLQYSQASICEIYPAKLTMNAVMCFFVTLQSSALSLIFERNASSWRMFPLFTHLILCIVFVWANTSEKDASLLCPAKVMLEHDFSPENSANSSVCNHEIGFRSFDIALIHLQTVKITCRMKERERETLVKQGELVLEWNPMLQGILEEARVAWLAMAATEEHQGC
ncbi:hypothetical protein ZIOFF_054059 [Zingiber officinale]|uniref:WAT1-related protein n=1 Tax=Zingiber officinale TaxID=94328 RepID=A0A8J5KJ49_ZINOF|nr:hypothetical protein ZIOFF_054059 [Zingiber officinale]